MKTGLMSAHLMRAATLVILSGAAGALTGCASGMNGARHGQTVEFVASNADSVLLDFGFRPEGEMSYAQAAADQQCGIFHRDMAVLESLNTRGDGRIRATYLCKK